MWTARLDCGPALPIWAALRSLGRIGVAELVDRHCTLASRIANGLHAAGYEVLNRVMLNQVLVRAASDVQTVAIRQAAQASGKVWFGPTVWQGRPAFRISVSSWRTEVSHADQLIHQLAALRQGPIPMG
jgi:glutamate/tyrosine decarboxylase-like PLP-dependent enzyme